MVTLFSNDNLEEHYINIFAYVSIIFYIRNLAYNFGGTPSPTLAMNVTHVFERLIFWGEIPVLSY